MDPTGKKFISLFLVFSLFALSIDLYAKKRGMKLIIIKTDGIYIPGELITVKEESLLLLDSETGADVSINIWNVRAIEIKGKSKAGKGIGKGSHYGLLIGGGLGVLAGAGFVGGLGSMGADVSSVGETLLTIVIVGAIGGAVGAIIGGSIGGIIGAFSKESEVIRIEGMAEWEIQETLDYLRKKARVRDYK